MISLRASCKDAIVLQGFNPLGCAVRGLQGDHHVSPTLRLSSIEMMIAKVLRKILAIRFVRTYAHRQPVLVCEDVPSCIVGGSYVQRTCQVKRILLAIDGGSSGDW